MSTLFFIICIIFMASKMITTGYYKNKLYNRSDFGWNLGTVLSEATHVYMSWYVINYIMEL